MKRGTKPQPTTLKLLKGNPGKRPLNPHEPKPSAGVPECPAWLDEDARAEWSRITPELERLGLLTTVDFAALANYCQAFADWKAAVVTLREEGRILTSEKGNLMSHPAVVHRNHAAALMLKFAVEFGFTPSSRSRVTVGKKDELDEFEAFTKKA